MRLNITTCLRSLAMILALFAFSQSTWAQRTIMGTVKDAANGELLVGAGVVVPGTPSGTITDLDGNFTLQVPDTATSITVSFIGYEKQVVSLTASKVYEVALKTQLILNEIVVVGYGTQKRKDLTGSITSINSDQFVKGNITSPEQLVAGKVAGVQITSNSGMPGAGSRIRIRGGSSLNASNDPLIVVDGVPLDNGDISGAGNPLNLINPNDIESMSILKDASATAIYGSRASNGVIIIKTKKGKSGDMLRVDLSSVLSLSQKTDIVKTLSADEFRSVVNDKGNTAQKALLGQENTNWQELIYRRALSHDENLSLSGSVKDLPYRVSLGYLNQEGILKTSRMDRFSGSLGLNPSFFKDHLRIDINLKGVQSHNDFADQGAIGAAVAFDPTQSVYSGSDQFGGYFEWLDPATHKPNTLATRNPVGLLEQHSNKSTVTRAIGNIQLDYRFHFLPDLRANLNLGLDKSHGKGTVEVPPAAASAFTRRGVYNTYEQHKQNKVLEFYLNYVKELEGIKSRIDVMAGYSYQDFIREDSSLDKAADTTVVYNANYYKTQNTLVSFYGRLNYALMGKYLVTFTLRRDGSSRFSPENRWGLFPSAALAWRIKDEGFLKETSIVSDLKLRLGYGVTGQQDVLSDYPYLAKYTPSEPNADYPLGGVNYETLRPEGYDANIKWEETATYNAGLDFGFLDGRISGAVDYYIKKTKDLLSVIPVPAGSNLTNRILTNIGSIENKGVEITLNATPLKSRRLNWDVSANVTFNENKITKLTQVEDPNFQGILVGGIAGGVGNTVQIHTVGYQTYTYYLWRQLYDANGKPLEGQYTDLNGDGSITAEDRIRTKAPDPNIFLGLSSTLSFNNLSLGFILRANLGGYMYNNISSNNGAYRNFTNSTKYLSNVNPSVLESQFTNNQYFSDYYLEDASFLRMDNISLSYQFPLMIKGRMNLRLTALVQNAFVLTKYSGLDPEIAGGIDNNFYPRPRTYSLAVNVGF